MNICIQVVDPVQRREDFIRTSICDEYSGSTKLLHAWIVRVIVNQDLVQIGRIDE